MKTKICTVLNPCGLHVRPSIALCREAMKYKSEIKLFHKGQEVNAKKSIEILTLAAEKGDKITIQSIGDDEEEAINSLVTLFHNKFGISEI
ncbi:MAG: HPr family phosphocarrier protein [Planctomycetes bacterium]|mgnify:CR=1 FL=1|jgi:phosphocarrier protein|nr:HPr family phosphocarrier protein [Planctomycetota bacterium]HON45547.1 HPr family phosphocarrier protein [Planctomycetota bacterium]HPY75517.1 HPr family phosphocarrier protein [Planctomycetota bacterium]HQB01130.1 HPr family phosphocarrier protein [Planctomycetota bacterium]